jgi:hypothetical protein
MKKDITVGVLLLATLLATEAPAEVIASRTRTGADFFSDATNHFVPLNNTGSTSLSFITTTDNQRVVISYNAECAVQAANFSTYLNIDILVDSIAAAPSDNDNAFCSAHNFVGGGWVSAVTTTVFTVPDPRIHTVQIRGNLAGFVSGSSWSVDDSSTIVMK